MGRHRIPEYEIREVSNAYAPAVARREPEGDPNGRIIVEVDEQLRGRDREEAIKNALEPYRQGWRGLIPAPVLAFLWAAAHKIQDFPRAASAVTGAGAAAVVGVSALAFTGVLDADQRRPAVIAASAVTQTVEATSATLEPTRSASTPPREPRRRRESATPAEAAFDGRPERAAQQPAGSPAPDPKRTTKSAEPKRTPTPREASHTEAAEVREEDRPTPSREPDRPTVDEQPDRPTPEPQPEPEPKRTPDPVVEVEVGGDDCHLVDLDVGVGDLLDAGVCV